MRRLSNMMLIAAFISTLFYSTSYPYIYAECMKVVPRDFISAESILTCISTIIFCKMWNNYSDKLFNYYGLILIAEIVADVALFSYVIITGNLNFYFFLNVLIYCIITRNISCGSTKMIAKVNPTEKLREQFDNNDQIAYSVATLIGAGFAMFVTLNIRILFILALIGNVVDNIFYLYIYFKIRKGVVKNERV